MIPSTHYRAISSVVMTRAQSSSPSTVSPTNPDRSDEGYRVICNAQWRSVEAYQAMRENPAPLPYLLICSKRSQSRGSDYGPKKTTVSAHEFGVHTKYSWELLRVTARVNAGAT